MNVINHKLLGKEIRPKRNTGWKREITKIGQKTTLMFQGYNGKNECFIHIEKR